VKHARPRRIEVTVSIDAVADAITLAISDDGIGFDTSVEHLGHLGLGTMRERASVLGGSVTIESHRGIGTRVSVVVPLATRQRSG
jgi:signal transduction histidine kinase